jgi:uncharacterized protein (TIGR03437 family)
MLIRTLSLLLSSGLALAASTFPVLKYSTYLRDSFTPTAIAVDSSGNIYVAGNAIIDPATAQTAVLVAKMNPQASQYLYVRFLNGSVGDYANAIAVDAAGNAYVAGSTASPDFPVTSGGNLGTSPAGQASRRSFVAKLDANGEVVFSDLLGGSTVSAALAVAVNGTGQVIVTGMSVSAGFPTTSGAYSVTSSANHPYLLELDPTGTKTVFSATGIGGSAIALDSSGNIYVAGTTILLDYPTTPSVYQATFPAFQTCFAPCQISFQGPNQYVTKVDPTGSKLIYSTAVSGTDNTTNAGLAIDAAGNVYLTGYAGSTYPFTVTPPAVGSGNPFARPALPFLSKLDPFGQTLLFSVPVGGAGVQVDATGSVYVGGGVGSSLASYSVTNNIPALASVPPPCLPNNQTILNSAYAAQVDSTSGNLLGSQFIGGSQLKVSAVALLGSTLWLAGATSLPDFIMTTAMNPGAAALPTFQGSLAGAYLGAVDFSQPQPPAGTPQIGCIVDAADLAPAGPAVRYQLLTIFGTGLGPATGVSATDNSTPLLAGVNIVFNSGASSIAAPLLYASSTQINFAVPLVPISASSAAMQLTVNGVAAPQRLLQLTFAKPSLFLNIAQTYSSSSTNPLGFVALALNADGSINSSTNPAAPGSALSVFVNGLTPDPQISTAPLLLFTNNGWSLTNTAQSTPFVLRVDLRVPSELVNNFSCPPNLSPLCTAGLTLFDVYGGSVGQSVSSSSLAFGGVVYVNRTQ